MSNALYAISKGALPKSNDINQLVGAMSGTVDIGLWVMAQPISVPSSAPTAATSSLSGNLNGTYGYVVTFVTGTIDDSGQLHVAGETTASPVSSSITVTNGQANLSNLPIGPSTCVARGIYRNQSSGSASSGPFYLVTTILNNTQTGYQDNTADSSLGVQAPSTNTTGSSLQIPNLTAYPPNPAVGQLALVNGTLYFYGGSSEGWIYMGGASPTFQGIVTASAFSAEGITGTSAGRYVGTVTNGAPTSGTFNAGDFVIDDYWKAPNIWVYTNSQSGSGSISATAGTTAFGTYGGNTMLQAITVSAPTTLTSFSIYFTSTGSENLAFDGAIFNSSGTNLTGWIYGTLDTSSGAALTFNFSSITLQPGQTYYVALYGASGSGWSFDVSYYQQQQVLTTSIGTTITVGDSAGTVYEGSGETFNNTSVWMTGVWLSLGFTYSVNVPNSWKNLIPTAQTAPIEGTWIAPNMTSSSPTSGTVYNIISVPSGYSSLTAIGEGYNITGDQYDGFWLQQFQDNSFVYLRASSNNWKISLTSTSDTPISVGNPGYDGWQAPGYFRIYGGYLQFVVCGSTSENTSTYSTVTASFVRYRVTI